MEDKKNLCNGDHTLDLEKIKELQEGLEDEEKIYQLSEMFKAMSDPTRLNILSILEKRELCVCDIAEILGASQSSISHHLRSLRNARLVKFRKLGRQVIYSVDDKHVQDIFNQGLAHVKH